MAKAQYTFAINLEKHEDRHLERIGLENHVTQSKALKKLVRERLRLETAGWKVEDEETEVLLESIVRLPKAKRAKLVAYLRRSSGN
jgi:hypothetical protein